jgi:SAM-dependent methyltransferase
MTDQLSPKNAYETLPLIYDEAGFSDFAKKYVPDFIQYLQEQGWIGRRVLDLGCGTGVSIEALSERRMSVTGVDASQEMIARATARVTALGYDAQLIRENLQNYIPLEKGFDLILCLNVLNHISSVRDLEKVFQRANWGLETGKVFLFDLHTIRGLSESIGNKTEIYHDSNDLFVVIDNQFDYETSSLWQYYKFFFRQPGGDFIRSEEDHILRGYPYRAVVGMLQRSGFQLQHAINLYFQPFDITTDTTGRVVIIAEKTRDFNQGS